MTPSAAPRAAGEDRPRRASRAFALVVGAVALVVYPDCGGDGTTASSGASPGDAGLVAEGARVASAEWWFRWNEEGVTRAAGDAGGWSVVTNRGYTARLVTGYFVDHSVSLGPCQVDLPADAGARLWRFPVGVRSARAHEDQDPSALELAYAEDLARPREQGPFPVRFSARPYCRAHWLVAIPGGNGGIIGEGAAAISLQLAGTWERDGKSGSFAVSTWWPEALLVDLVSVADAASLAAAHASATPSHAVISVERRLGALFEDIDFATATHDQMAGQMLINLTHTATAHVAFAAGN